MNLLFLLRPHEDYRPLLDLVDERPPRAPRAEVRPGVDPELAEDMEVLADALVPDGEAS